MLTAQVWEFQNPHKSLPGNCLEFQHQRHAGQLDWLERSSWFSERPPPAPLHGEQWRLMFTHTHTTRTHTCTHVCTYIRAHTCMHARMNTLTCTHMHICICTHSNMHTHMHTCMYTLANTRASMRICTHMHTRVHVRMCTHTHKHISPIHRKEKKGKKDRKCASTI